MRGSGRGLGMQCAKLLKNKKRFFGSSGNHGFCPRKGISNKANAETPDQRIPPDRSGARRMPCSWRTARAAVRNDPVLSANPDVSVMLCSRCLCLKEPTRFAEISEEPKKGHGGQVHCGASTCTVTPCLFVRLRVRQGCMAKRSSAPLLAARRQQPYFRKL